MIALPRLYAIADASFGDPVELARQLFQGGASLVQIRNKAASSAELLQQSEAVVRLAPEGARVIVNDRADIAMLAGAAGVHLGQEDLPVSEVRKIIGAAGFIGLSTHSIEQALDAEQLSLDYIAAGPVFPTTTKANPSPVLGVKALAEICRKVRQPVVAIGGITLENVAEVMNAGVASAAVIGGILNSPDVVRRTREWVATI